MAAAYHRPTGPPPPGSQRGGLLEAEVARVVGAARVEEHNAEVERARELFRKRRLTGPPDPLKTTLTSSDAASIVRGIGDVLVSGSARALVDAVLGAPGAGSGAGGGGGGTTGSAEGSSGSSSRQGKRKSSSKSSSKSGGKASGKGKG